MKLKIIFVFVVTFQLARTHVDTCCNCHHQTKGKKGSLYSGSDFGDITTHTTFIDKTPLIDVFFNHIGSGQMHLITCPHKFGKTANLNMIRRFVEIELDSNHDLIAKDESPTYNMFTDSNKKLKIASHLRDKDTLYEHHFNEYPVISVSFKDTIGHDYISIVKGIRENIRVCFEDYEWLYRELKEDHGKDEDESRYPTRAYHLQIFTEFLHGEPDEDEIADALYVLAKVLFHHYSYRHVFLIVDDYDAPVLAAMEHNCNVTLVNKLMEKIYTKLFNPDQRLIKYAIAAGTMNIFNRAKFGHIKHWDFLMHHDFAPYFGFTAEEVDQLTDKHGISKEEKYSLKMFYEGYNIFQTNTRIYNPFSVIHFICHNNRKNILFDRYWAESGQIASVVKQFSKFKSYRNLLTRLLVNRRANFHLRVRFNIDDLNELKMMMHNENHTFADHQAHLFLSYLFNNGFLTYTDKLASFNVTNLEVSSYLRWLLGINTQQILIDQQDFKEKLTPQVAQPSIYKQLWNKLFGTN